MASNAGVEKVIRIGGATASLADSALSVPQLLAGGALDYLVFDYLAEGSMGIFGRMQAAAPTAGYAANFLTIHVGPHLEEIAKQKLKVVANAGGVNPAGLAAALQAMIAEKGLSLTVAYVEGDDLRGRVDALRTAGHRDMFIDTEFPDNIVSANAYLGAFPVAAALAKGADIVITGRVVDSAVVLGPLIHEFGWKTTDLDLLAAGTLAGHLLECGAQVSGGTFTDWRDVPDWANIGFPIGECHADGSVVITKPEGTGGLVSIGTVSEQILYEVSDPADYIVADVRCDFSDVSLEQLGPNRVRVTGARGRMATDTYKACITFDGGWRTVAYQPIIGEDAAGKAQRQAEALFARGRQLLSINNLPDFTRTEAVLIGGEASFGAHAIPGGGREIICKLVVDHPTQQGAGIFAAEQWAGITGMSVGTSINLATQVTPMTGVFLFLINKSDVTATMTIDGTTHDVPTVLGKPAVGRPPQRSAMSTTEKPDSDVTVDLVKLAWVRSGDKGHLFNVAAIARKAEYLKYLQASLTPKAVGEWYQHLGPNGHPPKVEAFAAPGLKAINFVVHEALTGGINASTALDSAAKGMGQMLLRFPITVPAELAHKLT
ncbi:acyclic terpene utilization AtuA family protein [Fretibacter rubidus]|uniref:acyclic terpene utilization AtuA family protein n=1 Tax=Fretibacter rubidus TaxID=570162 RepID=UPI00352B46D9